MDITESPLLYRPHFTGKAPIIHIFCIAVNNKLSQLGILLPIRKCFNVVPRTILALFYFIERCCVIREHLLVSTHIFKYLGQNIIMPDRCTGNFHRGRCLFSCLSCRLIEDTWCRRSFDIFRCQIPTTMISSNNDGCVLVQTETLKLFNILLDNLK